MISSKTQKKDKTMSILAQLGGTEIAPTTLRIAAVGLASYGALTWVQSRYGVDILAATPNRILAAGVIAVASEFALRTFSSEKAMHLSRLKSSVRALQKDLQDPENREGVRLIFNDAGFDVSKDGMESLANGDYGSPEFKQFVDMANRVEANGRALKQVSELLQAVATGDSSVEETNTIDVTPEKESAKSEASQIKSLKGQNTKLRNKVNQQAEDIAELKAQMAQILGTAATAK